MSRRIRWILLALLVVIVGGAVALVLTQQPKLDDAQSKVDQRWRPLRAPNQQLALRYEKLVGALTAFDAAGGKDRGVSRDLHAALDRWNRSLKGDDAGEQADAANAVEAQGTRLLANALGSERLKQDKPVTDALAAFATTTPDPKLVAAYNQAVRDYEDERTGTLAQPVAKVFGFDARPVLVLGTGGS